MGNLIRLPGVTDESGMTPEEAQAAALDPKKKSLLRRIGGALFGPTPIGEGTLDLGPGMEVVGRPSTTRVPGLIKALGVAFGPEEPTPRISLPLQAEMLKQKMAQEEAQTQAQIAATRRNRYLHLPIPNSPGKFIFFDLDEYAEKGKAYKPEPFDFTGDPSSVSGEITRLISTMFAPEDLNDGMVRAQLEAITTGVSRTGDITKGIGELRALAGTLQAQKAIAERKKLEPAVNDFLAARGWPNTADYRDKARTAINLRGRQPVVEPGNYVPVPDPKTGATVGWVNPKSGHYRAVTEIPGLTGPLMPGPTADMRQKQAARDRLVPAINALEDLGKKVIAEKFAIVQKAKSTGRSLDAALGNDPEYLTYKASRMALAGNLAVAQQGSRPSDADIKAIWLPLVPDAFVDTKDSSNMKWDMIRIIAAVRPGLGEDQAGGTGYQVGEVITLENGKNIRIKKVYPDGRFDGDEVK